MAFIETVLAYLKDSDSTVRNVLLEVIREELKVADIDKPSAIKAAVREIVNDNAKEAGQS